MPRAPIFSSQQRKRPLGGVDTIAETPKTLVADKFMLESNECISLSVADPRRRFQPQVAATHFVRARLLLDPLPPAPSTDKRPRVVIANTADPRKRRQVIATQQTRLPGLLGANTPTINVSPVVGNWRGADQIEGNATVGYADFSVTGAHGTIVGTAGWKSYSQVLSQPVDLGEAINGTFTISGGDPTSLSGPVSPIIMLSNDGINWTTYKQPSVQAGARYLKFGYEAQGGSMSVNVSNMRGDLLITPRTELVTIACLATGIQSAYLTGMYAKVTDLQLTPAQLTSVTGAYAVPDQIEVGATGIPGGVGVLKLLGNTSNLAYATRTDAFPVGGNLTVETWAYLDAHDSTNGEIAFQLASDSFFAMSLYVNPAGYFAWNGPWGSFLFALSGVPVAAVAQRWMHLRVVCDQNANNTQLWINDQLVGITAYTNPTNTASRQWMIGNPASSYGWQGRLYDFRVWRIARGFATGDTKTRIGASANLILYLKASETSGATLGDSSGFGRDFILAGSVGNDHLWRPLNGFDVYLFDAAGARQSGSVRARWTGA